MKAKEETVTTPPPEESEQTTATPPSNNTSTERALEDPSLLKEPTLHKEESPSEYTFEDHPEAPLGAEDGSVIPPVDRTQCVPPDDPFSSFWSGQTADTSDTTKRRPRWLIRKPERRHSVDLEELNKQDPRPYRYVLRRVESLLPRPKFHSRYPDVNSVSFEYVGFILQQIVQQWLREQDEENLECEKRE